MTPEQCLRARRLLGWTEEDLAREARLVVRTIHYFEMGRGQPKRRTVTAIGMALEKAGVEFIMTDGGGVEVQLQGQGSGSDNQ